MGKGRSVGQLFIEILIGLGIITTALVVSLVVITHSVRVATTSRNRLEASKYAEKVIEALRASRDANKESFFANESCNPSCGSFGPNNMYACTMSCVFSPLGNATRVDVTVTMRWTDGERIQTLPLSTILTKYDL